MESFQDLSLKYTQDFKLRSGGYDFPQIKHVGVWRNSKYSATPVLTASLPICNQEVLIGQVLSSFFHSICVPTRLIIIFDACRDETEKVVSNFLDSATELSTSVTEVVLFRTLTDIFESSCDNFALGISSTDLFLTIQADNFLEDKTFISRSILAMQKYKDLSAITTRGIVPFDHPRKNKLKNSKLRQIINFPSRKLPWVFNQTYLGPFKSRIGFFGDTSSPPNSRLKFSKRASKTIFVGEAVVRGPILWRSEHLKLVNGFNDVAYFLGWDDYDASFRLFTDFNFRVAYLPSKAYSRVNSGTNSFPRSEETQLEYRRREGLANKYPGSISNYWVSREAGNSEIKIKWERRKI